MRTLTELQSLFRDIGASVIGIKKLKTAIIGIMRITVPKPVIICIGTPKVTGDSLGPRVGDILIEEYGVDAYVYGRTSSPVTGLNCTKYFEHIRTHHAHSLVVAVDACLGKNADVGKIKYSLDGLRAGSALGKLLGKFGDVGFLGVVAPKSENNLGSLQNAASVDVEILSQKIAKKIQNLIENLRLTYKF